MSSIVISGNTSGAITLDVPAVAGTNTVTIAAQTGTLNAAGPTFSAYPSTTQSISSGTFTKITYDTELFDTNSNFASSRFTPTVAGYYQVNSAYYTSTTSTGQIIAIYKNGAEIKRGTWVSFGPIVTVGGIVYCNGSSDYIEMYAYIVGASPVIGTTSSQLVWFDGSLVRGA